MKKNIFINLLSLSITFIILFFLLRNLQLPLLKLSLYKLKMGYLMLAFLFSFLFNPIFSSLQWRRILEAMGYRLPLKDIVFLRISTAPLKSVLPLKLGDGLRVISLKRLYHVPLFISALSVFFHLAMNILICIVVSVIGIASKIIVSPGLRVFIPSFLGSNFSIKNKLWIFKKIALKDFFAIFCISLVRFFFEIFSFCAIAKAIGIHIPMHIILLFYPLISLITNLPLAFEGLGVREGSVILFFSLFALREELFMLGFLTSLMCHLLVPFIGIFFVFTLLKMWGSQARGKIRLDLSTY